MVKIWDSSPKSRPSSREKYRKAIVCRKKGQKNAKKVYTFIKKIADECLGKKFLVKIPKKTNLNYSDEISWFETHTGNISLGPFGFRPIPISTDPRYSESSAFLEGIGVLAGVINADTLFEHYLDIFLKRAEFILMQWLDASC